MSDNTARTLQNNAEQSQRKFKSRVSKLSREQQMVEVSLWTNRLDRKLKLRLGELHSRLRDLEHALARLKTELPAAQGAPLGVLETGANDLRKELIPEVIELSVVAADHIYLLDSMTADYRARFGEAAIRLGSAEAQIRSLEHELDAIRQSKSFRFAHYLFAPLRALKVLFSAKVQIEPGSEQQSAAKQEDVTEQQERELSVDVTDFDSYNPHASTDNVDTGLAAFDDWTTSYRFDGKTYGSDNRPSVSDHLDNLIELHEVFSFKDKSVLELGPFEGANSKQMLDLGAKTVVGIEANREFFLKCCTVKNEFALDGAKFIYGDCLKLMEQHLFSEDFPRYDICLCSGILYHFADPLHGIDLLTQAAPIIYVWTQYASDEQPQGDWLELEDQDGRVYQGRKNTYSEAQHWGGVAEYAVWLTEPDVRRAFEDRGFEVLNTQYGESHKGKFISFVAERR